MAQARYVNLSKQPSVVVAHRDIAVSAAAHLPNEPSHLGIGRHAGQLSVDNRLQSHKCQSGLVGVVGQQMAVTSQPLGVDAVALEYRDGEIRADSDDNQRDKQLIAARQFGYEEDAREGRVHHSGHHSGHAVEREVAFGNILPHVVDVPQTGKQEAAEAADEQRRGESSATAACSVGGRGGKNLGDNHQGYIQHQQLTVAGKERVLHDAVPVALAAALNEERQAVVALAVERRKEEYQRAQHQPANEQAQIAMLRHTGKHILAGCHHAHEIERHEARHDAEQDDCRNAPQHPLAVELELEHLFRAREEIGEARCRDRGNHYRQQRRHRKVNHQHLYREHQTGYRSLEDACYGG